MTPAEFTAWREHLHLNGAEAARQLGIAPNTVTAYERGRSEVPRSIALACMAIAAGLPPWPASPDDVPRERS